MQRSKPSLPASLTRASAWEMARTSPARPTSPKKTRSRIEAGFAEARRDGGDDAEVDRRLVDLTPPATLTKMSDRTACSPPSSPAPRRAARRGWGRRRWPCAAACRGGRRDQRLHLDQDRPRAFDAAHHRRAGHLAAAARPGRAPTGLATSAQAALLHLEDADLVGRAEAVLHRAQDAVRRGRARPRSRARCRPCARARAARRWRRPW